MRSPLIWSISHCFPASDFFSNAAWLKKENGTVLHYSECYLTWDWRCLVDPSFDKIHQRLQSEQKAHVLSCLDIHLRAGTCLASFRSWLIKCASSTKEHSFSCPIASTWLFLLYRTQPCAGRLISTDKAFVTNLSVLHLAACRSRWILGQFRPDVSYRIHPSRNPLTSHEFWVILLAIGIATCLKWL